jgi:hypothetical protein
MLTLATLYKSVIEKATLKYGQLLVNQGPKKRLDKYIYRCIRVYIFKEEGKGMLPKIRTNIFLTRVQQKKLRGLSKKTGAPVAALVRKAIDEHLGKLERGARK